MLKRNHALFQVAAKPRRGRIHGFCGGGEPGGSGAFPGVRSRRRRNAATASHYEFAVLRARYARGTIVSRTLSFLACLAILAIGTTLGAHSRAQDGAKEASQETPPETSPQAPPQTPEPQPQAQPQQTQPPEIGDPRFAFHRIDNGFLRLDLRTGAVASCSQHPAGWACVLAPEERAAFDSEIARLQRENALLKNALLERGITLPNAPKADAPPPPASAPPAAELVPRPPQSVPPVASAPSVSPPKSAESDRAAREDAELERIMTMMEKVWRRLVEMMVNIQRDMQKKG
jgi:hypothetical protein